MSSDYGQIRVISRRYARALIDIAESKKSIDTIESEASGFQQLINSSQDLGSLLENPCISRGLKKAALLEIAKKAKFSDTFSNFLGVIAQNGRTDILGRVLDAIKEEARRRRGEIIVQVETAVELTKAQSEKLGKTLASATGAKVELDIRVDERLLGGLRVIVGSSMFDDTVANKLGRMKLAMEA